MVENSRVLNILVAGHSQHGKSSLIEAIVGKFPDNLTYELNHGTTVSLKVIQFDLKKKNLLINFLDSPGHSDFEGGIALGLEFADVIGLVISSSEGFQARTHWLIEKAILKRLPIIVIITKTDLSGANPEAIKKKLKKIKKLSFYSVVETSSKLRLGIEELIDKIGLQIKLRKLEEKDLSFLILGFKVKKGIGEAITIGILSGFIKENLWINDRIKIKRIFTLSGKPKSIAREGEIVQIVLNVIPQFELGSKYKNGKFISPKLIGILSEIQPRKEYYITIKDPLKFKIGIELLEKIKKIFPNLDYYYEGSEITILTQGDLQFDYLKESLEELIDFEIIGSKIKGIITINKSSRAKFETASVRIIPRISNKLTIHRNGIPSTNQYDILGAAVAYDAFHLDGLHVEIFSGKSEDHIAQAITRAIERVKIIRLIPYQDVIVRIDNFYELSPLIDKYNAEILFKSSSSKFFLQIKNEQFEKFYNSLMKISNGTAKLNLVNFEFEEKILSIDPGTRHFGYCLIEKGKLPSLWYVNLKKSIKDKRTHNNAKNKLFYELNTFLDSEKDLITKIFVGTGPGAKFTVDFLIEYFEINQDESHSGELNSSDRIRKPEIYLIDEFKTTKEALFHLQKGELVHEVKAKGFVDHAIAALLIARRGLKGKVIKIQKKPLTQLYDYIIDNYNGSYSFKTIHKINKIEDLVKGMYLRVKDDSKLDSNLKNGDIIAFSGFGKSYNELYATLLTGNKIIVKLLGDVKLKRDFFKIFLPIKQHKPNHN